MRVCVGCWLEEFVYDITTRIAPRIQQVQVDARLVAAVIG